MKVIKAFELKIDEPCTENFDAMPRTNCGMFCGKCQKEVIDFTQLTDVELIDILKKKPDTCGMYRNEQLNKFYQYEEMVPQRKPFRFWLSVLTFISLVGSKEVGAQVKANALQQKETVAGKNIPNGKRIYCKLLDKSGFAIPNVKVTAGNEVVMTDGSGQFDISNPFSNKTEVVTLLFEDNGNYVYEQIHNVDVKDAVIVFNHERDIKQAPTRDMSKLVATLGGMTTSGGRGGNIMGGGGGRSSNTITFIDGIQVRGNAPELQKEKNPNLFQRLFGKKAK